MRLTFLGTGTSMGVPIIGCTCPVCTSPDPRNRRMRAASLLEAAGLNILIDAGPDLRAQALGIRLARLDALLLTHGHADHVAGLDDLRPFNFRQRSAIPVYSNARTLAEVRERFSYAFAASDDGSTRPALDLCVADGSFLVGGRLPVTPLEVFHGPNPITAFRIGRLGYVTDASWISPASMEQLRGLDTLVLNALRFEPHPTHFSLAQALQVIAELAPRRAFLLHLTHAFDHGPVEATLPAHVRLAYDGLGVEIDD